MSAVAEEMFEYDQAGRMKYHPKFHTNQGKPWKTEELEYFCTFYEHDDIRTLSYALGRTEASLRDKYSVLNRSGLADKYRRDYLRRLNDVTN